MKNIDFKKASLALHKAHGGKLGVHSKVPLIKREDLSVAYTPGVSAVCELIANDKAKVFTHTIKANTVAVVSDGSAVLGLGNLGPEAALPVMEGKSILFKAFANVDAFPICLATQDTEEIIRTVKNIAPVFGGINLEDISAPRCFEIEKRLRKELNIPVFHDDQHGTAIVTLAALTNALKVVNKKMSAVRMVVNGAGAAAIAICELYLKAGLKAHNLILVDSKDTLYKGRADMNSYKAAMAKRTNPQKIKGGLKAAIRGADVFLGVSTANVLRPEWVETMAPQPIVFAMANPNPEISYEVAKKTKIAVFGTGRSDYPNEINNVLAFPGIFRGALDARTREITDDMKIAAARAIAKLVRPAELKANYIIPGALDKRVARVVAQAVVRLAKRK